MSYLLVGFVATAALLVLRTNHMHYAALGLLAVILGMAGLYFLQGAAFVAVSHIIAYAGSVLLLLLFSTLLLPAEAQQVARPQGLSLLLATGLVVALLWPLCSFIGQTLPLVRPEQPLHARPIAHLGAQLLGSYAFAFEWTGLVLLLLLVGAVYVAGK